MKCKFSVAYFCPTSRMRSKLLRQFEEYSELFDEKIPKLLNQTLPDIDRMQEAIEKASKLMHYHESTVVDLCQGDDECKQCLKDYADCAYSRKMKTA